MRYRTRATWWRSRPAHNPQRSNGACHPRTPPKAAQPTAQSPQPVKKEYWDGSTSLIYAYSARQGQERVPSPPRDVRFLGASHERRMGSKGALTELPPPLGTRRGIFREPCGPLFFFEGNKAGPRTSSGACSGLQEILFAR